MNIFKTYRKTSLFFLVIFILVGGLYWAVDYSQKFTAEEIASLEKQAESGDAESMYILGTINDLGEGVPVDYKTAKKYYELAAEKDYPKAFYRLGVLYLYGDGVEQNEAKAFDLFQIAAQKNVPQALGTLGVSSYDESFLNLKPNYPLALSYFKKAAELNDVDAQLILGGLYYLGKGTKQDLTKARFYTKLSRANSSFFSVNYFKSTLHLLLISFGRK